MDSMIRFSLFGNFGNFNTDNTENYFKLINFFKDRNFKPATTNELILQPDGQVRVAVMPVFFDGPSFRVEITSNRINFQKNIAEACSISILNDKFFEDKNILIKAFIEEMSICSNRIALNCDIINEYSDISKMPTQSAYFDDKNKTEMSVRNVARSIVEAEECNIIIEKYVNALEKYEKYSYDLNTLGENQTFRFSCDKILRIFNEYIKIAMDIEQDMNL